MASSESQIKELLLPQVLVLDFESIVPTLESKFPNRFQFLNPGNSQFPLSEFLTSHAQSVQALLIPGGSHALTTAVLDHLPSLKLVVTVSVGVDHLDLDELRRRGIEIAFAGDVFSEDVADMAVGLLIDVLRKLSAGDRFVRQRLLNSSNGNGEFTLGLKLSNKRIGIVGLGRIGTEVAKRLEAFGCRISYNSRTKKPSVSYSYYPDVHDLAANCDALVICCGLTEETLHMINGEVMLALGENGVIINIGRGAIIDEEEMVKCLIEGEIGGAGLDVFENEPHVPKQLFDLENVVLSPHAAVATRESLMAILQLAVDNLEAFFSNKPLVSPYVY